MSTDATAFVDEPSYPPPPAAPFVVGIGASAGGLEALERFFDNVPRNAGLAYVLVQHLSPDFRSLMDQLLARHTDLPIRLVEDGMRVQADHVYLMPPKKEMIISGGRLLLSERDRQHELTLPIDVFFRSLAQDCGRRGIAVVLSGGGSDGSRGIRAVHDAGGLVIVQDVGSAQFDGMPKTAREAGVADWVLPPQEMPRIIVDHTKLPSIPPARVADRTDGLTAVYQMLEREFGIDFTHYKPSTVTRRIERRLRLSRAEHIDDYVNRLRRGRDELDVLYRDLLIGVTRFFRNEEAFAVLGDRVLPELLLRSPRDSTFRVWVPGCATGEEVYSLAILLDETCARVGGPPFKIFATDVHRGSIEFASRAVFDEEAMVHVSPERRQTYFRARGRAYEIVPDLRQNIVFAPHNVIRDPPFTRVDFVSCRNLLIYLQPAAQAKAISFFHFALNRGGVLFLGPSESPGALAADFETVDRHWRIFRKYSNARTAVDARLRPGSRLLESALAAPLPRSEAPVAVRASGAQLLATYDALLDRFMPPSMLVTVNGELLHAFGGASRFLRVGDGRQALDLLDMVTPELHMVLAGGLRRARVEGSSIIFRGVRAGHDDNALYTVTIARIAGAPHVLVSLEAMQSASGTQIRSSGDAREVTLDAVSREQIGALEAELNCTKENLQAAIEELQASNEELQAANEELLTSNEELQSTNEELQSVNEELYTVNAEYQRKITELTELTNDVDNLLASTDVGTIFVDKQLKIRKFTPSIASGFDLLPQDIGRPIETFRHDLDHPGLADELRRVLATGERVEVELRERQGRTHFLRLLPYRAKGAIAGVVLTIIDVTAMKAAEDALFHERYLLNSLLLSVPDAIYFKDAHGKFIRANASMAARLGLADPLELVGKSAPELPAQSAALALHQQDLTVLEAGTPQHYRLERYERSGAEEWDLVTRLPLRDASGAIVGVIGIFRDVTQQKRAEERIQEAVRRRDQFLAMLSHELRNPLAAVVTATSLLKPVIGATHPRMLDILERQSQQMARLLDDLLEASRVTENKIELRKEVVDLRVLAGDAADAARSVMEARKLAFTIDLDSEPLWVEADKARLQQIQANLLHNAAKYTPEGGHVSFVVRREHGAAVIRVRDDGVGIAPEMLETVFDLFVQAGRTLDRAQGGIGVGLTLVRSLVRMHGGTVVALSEGEGKGTELVVRLPLTQAGGDSVVPVEAPSGFALRRGARIAIIEDNRDSREMLCEILSHAGFDCTSADNGAAGLALIESAQPDLAVVDVGLPELDGLELAKRVRMRESGRRMHLIALTGYGQREDRERALAAGFDLHLTKPLDPAQLLGLIQVGAPPARRKVQEPAGLPHNGSKPAGEPPASFE